MTQRIGDLRSENKIYIQFVYRAGNPDKLASKQVDALDQHSAFTKMTGLSAKTSYGSVSLDKNKIPAITAMSQLESYTWDVESEELNLREAPLLRFTVDPTDLYDSDDRVNQPADNTLPDDLIETISIGYQATAESIVAVFAETPEHRFYLSESMQPPITAKSLAHDEYAYLSWLTLFPPSMVKTYGRERLLSAPAFRIRELDDGAIIVICHDKPFDWETDCHDIADHIGLPSFETLGE